MKVKPNAYQKDIQRKLYFIGAGGFKYPARKR